MSHAVQPYSLVVQIGPEWRSRLALTSCVSLSITISAFLHIILDGVTLDMEKNYHAQNKDTSHQTTARRTALTCPSVTGIYLKSKIKPNRRLKHIKRSPAASRTTPSITGTSTMFNNAQNTQITGGSFNIMTVNNLNASNAPPLELLYRHVASNVILNAGGRADEVRCHPGTREEVVDRIEKWSTAQNGLIAPIFWLSGPAGAGKSAIVQTVAERLSQRNVPHANFFFFRADSTRNDASALLATLLHQIVLFYPSIRESLANLLFLNPLILNSTLEDQLRQLVLTLLRTVKEKSTDKHPLIILIDGLDECDSESKRSQQQILDAFDKVLSEGPCPFRLLVASRDEPQITMAFNRMASQLLRLYLDGDYSPEKDIRLFVNDQFIKVRRTHALASTLDATWPSVTDVDYIVEKSSGQFIYAATVMRFIMDSSASPKLSLERVQGAARLASKSPFSPLDAIYTYILSQVEDQETLRDILHAHLIIERPVKSQSPGPISFEMLLGLYSDRYTKELIISCLAELTPIAQHKDGKLLFYHASLSDYPLNQSRSREYFVDFAAFSCKVVLSVWKHLENEWPHRHVWIKFGIYAITLLKRVPPGLLKTLASSTVNLSHCGQDVFTILQSLFHAGVSSHDVMSFRQMFRQCMHSLGFTFLSYREAQSLPFGNRYFHMARAYHSWQVAPDNTMLSAMHPETDFDRHESAFWLSNLLHYIYRQLYYHDAEHFRRLLETWISWAVANEIPCVDLLDLPGAPEHFAGASQRGVGRMASLY